MSQVNFVQIASYPRSGNTWLRTIIACLAGVDRERICPDFHQTPNKDGEALTIDGKTFKLFKSHGKMPKNKHVTDVIWIVRHPLDVFLSSLDYSYKNEKTHVFINAIPKSADAIYADGEMGWYFDRFLNDLGESFFKSDCFTPHDNKPEILDSNYLHHYRYWSDIEKRAAVNVHRLKYERMLEDSVRELKPVTSNLLKFTEDELIQACKDARSKTTFDGTLVQGEFKRYETYLTTMQIDQFIHKYDEELANLGYV